MADERRVEELARVQGLLPIYRRISEVLSFLATGQRSGVEARLRWSATSATSVTGGTSATGGTFGECLGQLEAAGAAAICLDVHDSGPGGAHQNDAGPGWWQEVAPAVEEARVPVGVRLSGRQPVALADAGLAVGCSYVKTATFQEIGVLQEAVAAGGRRAAVDVLRRAGEAFGLIGRVAAHGAPTALVVTGGSFGLSPPALAVSASLLEARLAVDAGVRDVVLTYAPMGHVLQDVAAVQVLRSEGRDLFAGATDDEVRLYVAVASWPGTWPEHEGEAYAVLGMSGLVGGLSNAELGSVTDLRGGRGWSPASAVAAVQAERQLLDMLDGQALEASEERDREEGSLRATVRAVVSAVRSATGGNLADRIVQAIEDGVLPLGKGSHGPALARDRAGAVRWSSAGAVPVPAAVLDDDRRLLAAGERGPLQETLAPPWPFVARRGVSSRAGDGRRATTA